MARVSRGGAPSPELYTDSSGSTGGSDEVEARSALLPSAGVSLLAKLKAGKSKRETPELQPASAKPRQAAVTTPKAPRP